MPQSSSSGWPAPLEAYLANSDVLGYSFVYPPEYLECIEWDIKDVEADGDGHALSFLTASEVRSDLATFVLGATNRRLVPFARGGNGDELYCFDGNDANTVYVINLGDKRLRARNTGCTNFINFIDTYRANQGLPKWLPESKR